MFEDFCTPPEQYETFASVGAMAADRPPGTWSNTTAESGWSRDWHARQRGFPTPQNRWQTRSPPGTNWPPYTAKELITQGGPKYHNVGDTSGYLPRVGAYAQGFISAWATYAPFTGVPYRQWPLLGPQSLPVITAGGHRETLGSERPILRGGRGRTDLHPRFTSLTGLSSSGQPLKGHKQSPEAGPSYSPGDFQAYDDGTGQSGEGYFL
jgi:hypothetical protein